MSFYFTLKNDIFILSLRRADVLLGWYFELIFSSGNLSAISWKNLFQNVISPVEMGLKSFSHDSLLSKQLVERKRGGI